MAVSHPAPGDPETPVLSDADLGALLASCAGTDFTARRDTAIVMLFLDGGLRLSELAGLQVVDVAGWRHSGTPGGWRCRACEEFTTHGTSIRLIRHVIVADDGRVRGGEHVEDLKQFAIEVPQATLDDLAERLAHTRWPHELDGLGWENGTSPAFLRELVAWWRTGFDWRAQAAALNRFPQFRATVDGIGLHVVHVRGKGPAPLPLVCTHGWPSTFYELLPLVGLLTDPAGHGGDAADAFDLVIPSLPGYGFSDPLPGHGGSSRIPGLWARLMTQVLGYTRFGAHGGDIGAYVTNRLGYELPEQVVGIHVTMVAEADLGPGAAPPSDAERVFLTDRVAGQETGGGYSHMQRTRPQTLAYGLTDSPVGLAAWIVDKWWEWSDCDGDPSAASPRTSC